MITAENANNETISRLVRWAVNSNDWTWMPSYKDLLVYDTGVNKERTLGFEWNSHFNQHCDLVGNLLFCVDFKKINISWRNNQNNQDCLSCFFKIGNVGVFFSLNKDVFHGYVIKTIFWMLLTYMCYLLRYIMITLLSIILHFHKRYNKVTKFNQRRI